MLFFVGAGNESKPTDNMPHKPVASSLDMNFVSDRHDGIVTTGD